MFKVFDSHPYQGDERPDRPGLVPRDQMRRIPAAERTGDRVRLITRGGYNWTSRYPWIVEAARKVRGVIPTSAAIWWRCGLSKSLALGMFVSD